MLMLLFYAGSDLYAIDCSQVVEVLPMVVLRKIHHVPDYVAGVFNYRGSIVPTIDLCHLIQGTDCRARFSTRIIMVNYTTRDGSNHHLGLMAERVTETLNRPDLDSKNAELPLDSASYLGEIFMDEKGMIQRLHWEHLVSDAQHALLAGGSFQANGASRN